MKREGVERIGAKSQPAGQRKYSQNCRNIPFPQRRKRIGGIVCFASFYFSRTSLFVNIRSMRCPVVCCIEPWTGCQDTCILFLSLAQDHSAGLCWFSFLPFPIPLFSLPAFGCLVYSDCKFFAAGVDFYWHYHNTNNKYPSVSVILQPVHSDNRGLSLSS